MEEPSDFSLNLHMNQKKKEAQGVHLIGIAWCGMILDYREVGSKCTLCTFLIMAEVASTLVELLFNEYQKYCELSLLKVL